MEPLLAEPPNTHRLGGGRPRVPDRTCADGLFFVLRTGCQWHALSATGLCPSSTAPARFQAWVEDGLFSALLAGGPGGGRRLPRPRPELAGGGRGDDQGCLGGGEKTGPRPVDRSKSGTKRSRRTEASGVPVGLAVGLAVAGANKNACQPFVETRGSLPVDRPVPTADKPPHLCLDKGHDFAQVRWLAEAFGCVAPVRSRGQQTTGKHAGQKARRWPVERTHSWMIAARRLHYDRLTEAQRARLSLVQGSLLYRDKRLEGFDAAALVEVIEHLDPPRLRAAERVVFEFARPGIVIVTTPNRDYNPKWETLPAGKFRHRDYRFEWSRAEFQAWASSVAARFGYAARFLPVGVEELELGAPTQMGIFQQMHDAV